MDGAIGAFPQEIEAYHKIQWFIGLGYSLLQTMTIVQLGTYYLYNGKFHPFAKIVMPTLAPKGRYRQPIALKVSQPTIFR